MRIRKDGTGKEMKIAVAGYKVNNKMYAYNGAMELVTLDDRSRECANRTVPFAVDTCLKEREEQSSEKGI